LACVSPWGTTDTQGEPDKGTIRLVADASGLDESRPNNKGGLISCIHAKASEKLPVHLYGSEKEALHESRKLLRAWINTLRGHLTILPADMVDDIRMKLAIAETALMVCQEAILAL
jgi:hypothetical protein